MLLTLLRVSILTGLNGRQSISLGPMMERKCAVWNLRTTKGASISCSPCIWTSGRPRLKAGVMTSMMQQCLGIQSTNGLRCKTTTTPPNSSNPDGRTISSHSTSQGGRSAMTGVMMVIVVATFTVTLTFIGATTN